MSSSISLNLAGVGEEIAVAVAEAMRKQQATFQCQTAGIVAKQVSEQVAAALKTALLDVQTPTFDVREQILGTCLLDLPVLQSSLTSLANVNFMLACYQGTNLHFDKGITIVVLKDPVEMQNYAVVVSNALPAGRTPLFTILRGPFGGTDAQALLGLLEETKRTLTNAVNLREGKTGFTNLNDVRKR
jgi:hypothetical protein